VGGFPSARECYLFEAAWQKPYSHHLMARHVKQDTLKPPAAPDKDRPFPLELKRKLGHPLRKVQVLQYMLAAPYWAAMRLEVQLYSQAALGWWTEARRLGPLILTNTELKKWRKEREPDEDAWGAKGAYLDRLPVNLDTRGVDGDRLSREEGRHSDPDGAAAEYVPFRSSGSGQEANDFTLIAATRIRISSRSSRPRAAATFPPPPRSFGAPSHANPHLFLHARRPAMVAIATRTTRKTNCLHLFAVASPET